MKSFLEEHPKEAPVLPAPASNIAPNKPAAKAVQEPPLEIGHFEPLLRSAPPLLQDGEIKGTHLGDHGTILVRVELEGHWTGDLAIPTSVIHEWTENSVKLVWSPKDREKFSKELRSLLVDIPENSKPTASHYTIVFDGGIRAELERPE